MPSCQGKDNSAHHDASLQLSSASTRILQPCRELRYGMDPASPEASLAHLPLFFSWINFPECTVATHSACTKECASSHVQQECRLLFWQEWERFCPGYLFQQDGGGLRNSRLLTCSVAQGPFLGNRTNPVPGYCFIWQRGPRSGVRVLCVGQQEKGCP